MRKEETDLGFIYSEDNFDPTLVRNLLGLGDRVSISLDNMHKEEKRRLAGLLYRTGNITEKELNSLGLRIVKRENKILGLVRDFIRRMKKV